MVNWKINNFDIIRLLAAFQVALKHSMYHLDFFPDPIKKIIDIFPGVPIFFFISGFLVYKSFEKSRQNNHHLYNFFMNRCIRLYPGLLLCFLFSCFILFLSGNAQIIYQNIFEFVIWCLTAITFLQFYNPPFLRDFGVGAINGSLWSISVEIQFYLLMPLIFLILNKKFIITILVLITFFVINIYYSSVTHTELLMFKLFSASFLPWVCYFIFGATVSKYFNIFSLLLRIPLSLMTIIYLFIWQISISNGLEWDGSIYPLGYFCMCILLLKISYYNPQYFEKLLRKNDISYGIYIYHMPIINYFVYMELTGLPMVIATLIITIMVAYLSWTFVEKPALKLKKFSLRY
jgi:peptidoglycan/LPS O-acetylase OafA/YrhL